MVYNNIPILLIYCYLEVCSLLSTELLPKVNIIPKSRAERQIRWSPSLTSTTTLFKISKTIVVFLDVSMTFILFVMFVERHVWGAPCYITIVRCYYISRWHHECISCFVVLGLSKLTGLAFRECDYGWCYQDCGQLCRL